MIRAFLALLLLAGSAQAQAQTQMVLDVRLPIRKITLTETPEHILFKGNVVKTKTADPRVLGDANFLFNQSGVEYRVVRMSWLLDRSQIRAGEAVESDIGFTIIPDERKVALNSGEEIVMVHDYAVGPNKAVEWAHNRIPGGGFPVKPGAKLSIGSVSAFFQTSGGGAVNLDDARLAATPLMALEYEVELVRADKVEGGPVTTYRSPYRDRSYVADPSRPIAPYTSFRNTSGHPVRIQGVGLFFSNLTSTLPSAHRVSILVNGVSRFDVDMGAHHPGKTLPAPPFFLPVDLTVQPGETVSVRGNIGVDDPLVFDFASFLLAGPGLEPDAERLSIIQSDLNGDKYPDLIDLDATGTIWASLGVPGGHQDTQVEWMRNLPKFDRVSAADLSGDGIPDLRIEADNGFCMNLISEPARMKFRASYCSDAPDGTKAEDLWGDFNGDGWPDRFRIDPTAPRYLVALGGPKGLGAETPWVIGYGKVDRLFAWDGNADGKTDVLAQWGESGKWVCVIWMSDGSRFNRTACPKVGG